VADHGLDAPNPSNLPTVTVVTPTFNHAAYIGEAVESVLAQTFSDWELVVVDDGSTDETVSIARAFQDPRIRVLANPHRGLMRLADSYRAALEVSGGRLVAILEGDDRWPPDKLARQVPDFADEAVVLSYGAGTLIDDLGCTYGRVVPALDPAARTNRPVGAILPGLLAGNPILSPTVVVRRAALDAIGGFWQPAGVPYLDHPTWLRLALEGPFAYQGHVVGAWRRHLGQWTSVIAAGVEPAPELAYLSEMVELISARGLELPGGPDLGRLEARHRVRAQTNRWRLALLTGTPGDVASAFGALVRSGSPRLVAIGLAGLAARAIGTDLEWVQQRRHRVSWPSRHHVRRHAARS